RRERLRPDADLLARHRPVARMVVARRRGRRTLLALGARHVGERRVIETTERFTVQTNLLGHAASLRMGTGGPSSLRYRRDADLLARHRPLTRRHAAARRLDRRTVSALGAADLGELGGVQTAERFTMQADLLVHVASSHMGTGGPPETPLKRS